MQDAHNKEFRTPLQNVAKRYQKETSRNKINEADSTQKKILTYSSKALLSTNHTNIARSRENSNYKDTTHKPIFDTHNFCFASLENSVEKQYPLRRDQAKDPQIQDARRNFNMFEKVMQHPLERESLISYFSDQEIDERDNVAEEIHIGPIIKSSLSKKQMMGPATERKRNMDRLKQQS